MKSAVIDTNVLMVANKQTSQAGEKCVLACARALLDLKKEGRVVLDEGGLILKEYMGQRLSLSGQPGVGDVFFKWLFDNRANLERCERVRIHENKKRGFDEFPDDADLAKFDPDDRKFVAAARASDFSPAILNAVDSDWWDCRAALEKHGIRIKFLCPEQFSTTRRPT